MTTILSRAQLAKTDRKRGIDEEAAELEKAQESGLAGDVSGTQGFADPIRADRTTVMGARARMLSTGSNIRDSLMASLPGAQSPFGPGGPGDDKLALALGMVIGNALAGRSLMAGLDGIASSEAGVAGPEMSLKDLDPDTEKAVVEGLRDLGFELDDLSDPRAADAISALKEYAGFPGTPELDFDFLVSMFMAKAQEDRAKSSGASGIPSSRGAAQYAKEREAGGPARGMEMQRAAPVDVSNWSPGAGDVTPQQLQDIARQSGHSLTPERAAEVAPQLNVAMAEAGIDTPRKKAAFVAQLMHESGGFRYNEEIASGSAYEGRRDLGNTQPGDGQRFKGRGFIQLTGRANYAAAGRALGLDLVNHPELAATDANAARVAAWYWNSRGLSSKAEAGDFDGVTRGINGGTNGAADRNRIYQAALGVLADSNGLPSTGNLSTVDVSDAPRSGGGSSGGMTDDITPVNQADGGSTRLGNGSSTLRGAGCMLSAYGMAAQAISDRTDGMGVRQLNDLVRSNGGFSGSSLIGPSAARAMGMRETGRETITTRNAESRINEIAASLEAGNPVVLGVDYKAGSRGSGRGTGVDHWITITGRDPENPNRFIALDPAGGRQISLEVGPNGMLTGSVGSKNYVAREMITFEAR